MNPCEKNTFINSLSTRSRNGLARCFGRDKLDTPEIIAEVGMKKLKMTNQLGKMSFREIALALFRFGYIDDVEEWLES